MKKQTSRTNDLLPTRKGLTMAIEPATTAAIKEAAPISSPTASDPEFIFMAANVLKTSGDPLPNARKVTPAYSIVILTKMWYRGGRGGGYAPYFRTSPKYLRWWKD